MATQGTNDTFNLSLADYDCDEIWSLVQNLTDPLHNESPVLKWLILASYLPVSIVGALGNLLVIAAVLHNPSMRTARNYFIINLALSDLLMCTITVPFTLRFLLETYWDLGEIACKVVASLLGTNIFVSNLSVIAIGLDRYLMILFPTDVTYQRLAVLGCFLVVWLASVSLALPLYFSNDLNEVSFAPDGSVPISSVCEFSVFLCGETTNSYFGRNFKPHYYTGCFLLIYCIPLCSLSFFYGKILCRLENRPNARKQHKGDAFRQLSRTASQPTPVNLHKLLISIVVVYAVTWFPLMIYNVIVAIEPHCYQLSSFAFCHVSGMLSTCLNPIIYGVFNSNFRHEFTVIYYKLTFRNYAAIQRRKQPNTRVVLVPDQDIKSSTNRSILEQSNHLAKKALLTETLDSAKVNNQETSSDVLL